MRSSSEEGSYLRLVDVCVTQFKAKSNTAEEEKDRTISPRQRPGRGCQNSIHRKTAGTKSQFTGRQQLCGRIDVGK